MVKKHLNFLEQAVWKKISKMKHKTKRQIHTGQSWWINSVLRSRQWTDHRESKDYIFVHRHFFQLLKKEFCTILYSGLDLLHVRPILVKSSLFEKSKKSLWRGFIWKSKAEKNSLKRENVIVNEDVSTRPNQDFQIVTFLPELDSLHSEEQVTFWILS